MGQRVRLSTRNLPIRRPLAKLGERFVGPLRITEQVSSVNYRLQLPDHWNIHDVFHVSLLEPWAEDSFEHRNEPPPPPPDLIDGEEHFEIREIKDSRRHYGQLQYLIAWKGYDSSEDSWVPATEFHDDDPPVLEFHSQNPDRPARVGLSGANPQGGE